MLIYGVSGVCPICQLFKICHLLQFLFQIFIFVTTFIFAILNLNYYILNFYICNFELCFLKEDTQIV